MYLLVKKGKKESFNSKTAGGGGGTFVVKGNNKSLIIAGGGGGIKNVLEQHPGCDASINTTGNGEYNLPLGSGGSNGNGEKASTKYSGTRRKKKKTKQSVGSIHQDKRTTVRFVRT